MRPSLRRSTISILLLALLCLCATAPIVLISFWHFYPSIEQKEFIGGASGIVHNISHWQTSDHLKSIEQEVNDEIKEPKGVVYRDEDSSFDKYKRNSSSENFNASVIANVSFTSPKRSGGGMAVQEYNATFASGVMHSSNTRPVSDEKIRCMEDQVITARAFLHFTQSNANANLMRELKQRIKEIERVLSQASKDSDLHRSALQKMKSMENTLYKAKKAYPDCSAMASKLRAMTYNTEEQLKAQINQVTYLTQLASRTFPKGLHCLTMQLTTEYFALLPEKRMLPYSHKFQTSDLYHYAVFSDNILACAVVVNSTIANSMEQDKIVFHVVTDPLNFPSMVMWFLMNPPGKAAIQIQSTDEFKWLSSNYGSVHRVSYLRYTSPLNYLCFYLPKIFPSLNKILLLDHDVVVQKDLRRLWSVGMRGKVVGVVGRCKNEISSQRLETIVDFSDSTISKRFDPKACVWAFGMNMFDLQAWRRESLTNVYEKLLQLGKGKNLWKAGRLGLGQLVFYNHTVEMDRRWHLVGGLGQDSSTPVSHQDIKRAAVIHYDGLLKPWLEIAIPRYRPYWNKHLHYKHPHLQQCNIHP